MIEINEVIEIVKGIIREELRIKIDGRFCGTPEVFVYIGEDLIKYYSLPSKD